MCGGLVRCAPRFLFLGFLLYSLFIGFGMQAMRFHVTDGVVHSTLHRVHVYIATHTDFYHVCVGSCFKTSEGNLCYLKTVRVISGHPMITRAATIS